MSFTPSYARPTLSSLLKHASPEAEIKAQTLADGSRRGTIAIKDSLVIKSKVDTLTIKTTLCTTCDRNLPTAQFPKHPEGSQCTHDRETCRRCWHQWLGAQVASLSFDQIRCAQCPNVLSQAEIRALATRAVFERYLDATIKATMSADPNFRWCIAARCKSGQIHSEGDIFRCVQCSHRACSSCNVAWHEGESCTAYQARIVVQPKEEESSAKMVEKIAKMCPGAGCGRKIEKHGGCDHMTCRMCGHHFCWICLANYGPIFKHGNHMHKRTCPHYRVGPAQVRPTQVRT